MSFDETLRISGSALAAQRLRMNTISNNLANAQTTQTVNGQPFKRQLVSFRPMFQNTLLDRLKMAQSHQGHMGSGLAENGGGVMVNRIAEDSREGRQVYEPSHPDADEQGYVTYPNINVIEEMADMMSASRAYEASVSAFQAAKTMALKALEIGRA